MRTQVIKDFIEPVCISRLEPTINFGCGTYTARRLELLRRAMKPARMGWVVESILDQIEWKIKINEETFRDE